MTQLYANNAKTTLASGVTDVATSLPLSVGTGALFPSPTGGDFFMATLFEYGTGGEINHEIVKCTARSGDTLTVERGQESTTNRAWSTGTRLELRLTKAALDTYVTKTDAQTLTSKTLVVANNTVTTAASGNLTSTELNAALAELQGDVDTRALNSALTTHEADTSTHGVTGAILGTEDVYDTPVDGVTWLPVSSNWAYDHANGADPHTVYPLAAGAETISGNWTITGRSNARYTKKTASFTAVAGERIAAVMTSSAWTLTLPASPSVGDTVHIKLYDGDTNNLTIARNGSNIMGSASDLTADLQTWDFSLTYVDATIGWAL